MTSELRRSFKQKAKEAFGLPFRFRMGLEKIDARGMATEEFATRSASFDLGYFTPVNHEGEEDTKVAADLQPGSLGEEFVMIGDQDKENKKKPQSFVQPKGTLSYTVSSTDTLPSIAAQFETTTSELKKLNRLMSDMVFPGKVIYVPNKDYVPSESSSFASTPSPPPLEETPTGQEQGGGQATVAESDDPDAFSRFCTSSASSLRMPDPDLLLMGVKPILSVARQTSSASATGTMGDAAKQMDEDWHEHFIKLNVNHIANGKDEAVGGVLLVTPNAVMFESNSDDELVIKNRRDAYDVVVPMAIIVGVTICHDLGPAAAAAKSALKEALSFEDDVFDVKTVTGSSASDASKTLAAEGGAIKADCVSAKLDSRIEGIQTASTGGGDGAKGSSGGVGGAGNGEGCSSVDLFPGKNSTGGDTDQGQLVEVQDEGASGSKEQAEDSGLAPPPPEVSSLRTDRLAPDVLQPDTPGPPDAVCQTWESFTQSHVLNADSTTQGDRNGTTTQGDRNGTAIQGDRNATTTQGDRNGTTTQGDRSSTTTQGDRNGTTTQGDRNGTTTQGDRNGKHQTVVDEVKQTKTNNKELSSESSAVSETPSKRCSALVGNIFRFQSGGSANDASGQTPEKGMEKEGDVDPGKDLEGGCSTPTHRLMTRTLESLSSYSRPLVDLSSSLFSRSGSDSKSPKKEDERSELSPKLDNFKDKEKDQCPETVQTQRVFFLRPFDMLRKRSRGSSAESTEEASATGQERSSVSGTEEPTVLYLCLKIGQYMDWSALKHCPEASYIRSRLKPEYWFTIPSNRVDHLYSFFLQWLPNISGAVDAVDLVEKGFVVISSTDGNASLEDESNKDTSSSSNKEWEIINAKEVRRMINIAEIESLPLPDLSEDSKIMNDAHVRELCFHLPPRAEGCPWQIVYSSDKHGFSLKTLYRRMVRVDSAVLLIIKDDNNHVFGAMLPCALKMSDGFYGSGESYLFSFYPAFRKFPWTGQNNYFIKGNAESLSVGAGEGVYGLWLDGDLYHGRTQPCLTYDNDLLTVTEDFVVQCLEVWKFV